MYKKYVLKFVLGDESNYFRKREIKFFYTILHYKYVLKLFAKKQYLYYIDRKKTIDEIDYKINC